MKPLKWKLPPLPGQQTRSHIYATNFLINLAKQVTCISQLAFLENGDNTHVFPKHDYLCLQCTL